MRAPMRSKAVRSPTTHVISTPAPLGGWNTRDGLSEMPPQDAIALDNWMPRTAYVEVRGGYEAHATGMTGTGKTLVSYNTLTGTHELYCATASGVYNVTAAGPVGSAVAVRTNGKHQTALFGDGTNNYLIMVNGVDSPLYYNGTSWVAVTGISSPALTGLTTTTLVSVNSFKGRLFFIQNNSLSFWYLPAAAAGGALTQFDLTGECKRGGFLMAMGTWTRDGGGGQDDTAVFITSEGEAIVYQGTNPSSSASWAKVGSYYIGKPVGRRCVTQLGGDLVIITENGTYPLSAALQSASIDYKNALSFKIEPTFTTAARLYADVFGWEATVFPAQAAMIVNVPHAEGGTHDQYVMNTITKAWCQFNGWNAEAFCVMDSVLYFTTGTTVKKAWTGHVDGSDRIIAYGKTSFNYFGTRGSVKRFTLFRPTLISNGEMAYRTDIDVDFEDDVMAAPPTYSVVAEGVWDSSLWDVGYWVSGLEIVKRWTTVSAWPGFCVAGKVKVSTNLLDIQWTACDYVFERGGTL